MDEIEIDIQEGLKDIVGLGIVEIISNDTGTKIF